MTHSRIHRLLHTPVPVPQIRRWSAHVIFAAIAWPCLTTLGTAFALAMMPYYAVSLGQALLAGAAGTLLRLPDMILVGAIFFGLSGFIFSRLGAEPRAGRGGAARLFLEPVVTFVIGCFGIAVWYPAVLSQPLFELFATLPVAGLLLLLAALGLVGVVVTGRSGMRMKLAAALFAVGLLSPGPQWLRARIEPFFGAAPSVVLLGVDSISHSDDIAPLADWVKAGGGTWYERAVTPGLFTNAVWTSILTMRPVREHGVFHGFQRVQRADATLLHTARSRGYRTIAHFTDQLTAAVGSSAGFDEDHSGPVGWRQVLLPMVANSSVLVPVLGPALPRPWPGASPSNEAGTFTYDVRREVRQILRAGAKGERTFVAAHLTYTHLPAYPGSLEMSMTEIKAVLRAPAWTVRDRTIDWQDVDGPDDPLPLNQWKIRRLQTVIQREVSDAQFLQQGGQLVLFSDHGSRRSVTLDNFKDHRYHHVLLATFGLAPRCPAEPISLIDIGGLMGFSDSRAEPTLEFTFAGPEQWPELFRTARLRWSGDVDLDETLLAQVFVGLRRHTPWPVAAATGAVTDPACR